MPILGIDNRTENWKTARYLAPLFGANSVRLGRRLLLGEEERVDLQHGEVTLELFWKGLRDYRYAHKDEVTDDRIRQTYLKLFKDLQQQVRDFGSKFAELKDHNYASSADNLVSNILNTEIDIVLQSPGRLFIGEAKGESKLGGDGSLVLVHQLIRQYVTARILADFVEPTVKIIPFVVGTSRSKLLKHSQVKFMLEQEWMRKENVLEWADMEALR